MLLKARSIRGRFDIKSTNSWVTSPGNQVMVKSTNSWVTSQTYGVSGALGRGPEELCLNTTAAAVTH